MKFYQKLLINSLVLVSLTSIRLAAADTKPTEMKLAVVEFQKALTAVDEGKTTKARLEKEFNDKKKVLDVKEANVKKLKDQLEDMNKKVQNPAMMSPEIQANFKKKFEEYQKEATAYQTQYEDLMKDARQKEMTATQEIITKLQGVAADIARTKGYTMVLEKSAGVVYASSDIPDVTESVIQAYNQKHKDKSKGKK